MRTRLSLIASVLFSLSAVFAATPPAKPNFLLIIADDFTFSDVGCYGGQAYTPTIDGLAKDGLRFTRCFQAAPMCSPTRHALYTGMYPIKTGAYPNHTFVSRPNTISIAQRLQSVGYRVALSGVNNGSDHYGIRSVRSEHYKYIWNFTPNDPYANASMNNETYRSWTRAAAAGDATAKTAIARYLQRAEIEFYDVIADPEEFNNLAADPKLADERDRHRAQLDAWMKAQGDRGQATEMEALQHMKRYVEDPGAEGGAAKQKKKGKK